MIVEKAIEISIMNVLGEIIQALITKGNHIEVDVQNLQEGMYFLKLNSGENISYSRFLKE